MAVDLLDVQSRDRVLDVGTGHGATLVRLAERAVNGHVTGIDFSDVMLSAARRRNRALIREGRVEIIKGDAHRIPLTDGSADRAMAMHTVYFWDPAEPYLCEIARILVPGGIFVLGFRPAEDEETAARLPAPVYRMRTTGGIETLLGACGFHIERCERRDRRGDSMVWLRTRRI